MFMSDPDFDDEFSGSPGFEYGQAFPSPDSKQRQLDSRPPLNRPAYDDGALGTPQNSRARMLAQQREIQLKKRQSNMQSGGMVRSSLDSGIGSPMRQSADSQFTPAVRQFSAPKATARDPSFDASPEKGSEFTNRPKTGSLQARQSTNRYSSRRGGGGGLSDDDEEDGGRALEAARRADERHRDRGDRGDRQERQHRSSAGTGRRGRHSDDEEESFTEDRRASYNGRSSQQQGSRNNREDWGGGRGHEDHEGERDRARDRHSYSRDKDKDCDRDREREREREREKEKERDRDNRDSRGWTGASGGRDLSQSREYQHQQQQQPSSSAGGRGASPQLPLQAVPVVQAQPALSPVPSLGAPLQLVPPDLSDMRAFLTSPLPKNVGTLQCYIRRNKSGTNKLFPIYSLYLKEGDVFLMASKKRPKNKTSNYLISMDQNDLHRQGRNYLGKLRSNFMGTEFQVFDNGVNPRDTDPDEGTNGSNAVRCELGAVMYAANVLGSRGPRKMQVALPGLDEQGNILHWKDTGGAGEGEGSSGSGSGEDILTRMKDRNLRDLVYLINKPPRWNEQVGAYVLNFNGRVTMASVKNFQLVDPDEQNAVVLQFGRVGKDEFTMDLQHPISPFQAFAVTLSSFDSKIACD